MSYEQDSYERYKQYRLNKYIYEYRQRMMPFYIVVATVTVTFLRKYILIALAVLFVLAVIAAVLFLYLKKQLKADQEIPLSKEDAKEGVTATINVSYQAKTASFVFDIPAGVEDGRVFVAKNILFENKKGKKQKKNVYFKVRVLEK